MTIEEIRKKLSVCRVGVAGAGGLGSNVAVALVRCGLGKLVIADFDKVEASNLNRQYYFMDQIGTLKVDALKYNLLRINPTLVIECHPIHLTPYNIPISYRDVDLLIEAFDQADQKQMLIETALTEWPDRPLIIGNGMAGFGDSETITIKKTGNLVICGDGSSGIAPENPPLAPRVGIVASIQANEALKILLSKESS